MRLSAHFDTTEFRCRDGTPAPPHSHDDLRNLCRTFLEPLRARYGPVRVISGYRTPSWNRRVSGAPRSFHLYERDRAGAAADIVASSGTPRQWYAALERLNPGGLGLYSGHVHVDNRRGRARW